MTDASDVQHCWLNPMLKLVGEVVKAAIIDGRSKRREEARDFVRGALVKQSRPLHNVEAWWAGETSICPVGAGRKHPQQSEAEVTLEVW